ncbi:MAG: AI-2E family transporter [Candidatus Humimicrobiaceae bacterium]|jgi:predicted PurR-regulated permease PerM|nr:AI-2E family transporter [Actinomycetota bacterium]MDY0028163.1 AI-2E family transporter [Candidatus Humimicrobiaceae bacterium]
MRLKKFSGNNEKIKKIGVFSWSIIGLLIIVALIFYLIYLIRSAIIPLIIAVAIAYLLTPLVIILQKKMRRVFAVTITFLIFIGIIFTTLFFVIPVIIDQFKTFINSLPLYIENLSKIINDFLKNSLFIKNIENITGEEIVTKDASIIADYFLSMIETKEIDVFQGITTFGRSVVDVILYIVVGPLLGLYILLYSDRIRPFFMKILPARFRKDTNVVLDIINKVAGKYITTQILVSIVVGILCTIVLLILKVDLAVLLGFIAGFFNIIPLIGPIIGAIPAALTALFVSPLTALIVIISFTAIQQIDNYVISPNIMKYRVGVHPGIIIFSLMAGGALMGFWGLLIAVPVVAIVQELIKYYFFEKNKRAS